MAGDPDYNASLEILKGLPDAGADIIELGFPFSDPVADGPIIQAAGVRSLKSGTNLKAVLDMVREFRKENTETPIVLMGYFNPVYVYGTEKFAADAKNAGVDGVLIVDLPPEEAPELQPFLDENGIHFIRLITPNTDEKRLQVVLDGASGFLYYVTVEGITGGKSAFADTVKNKVSEIKKHTNLPIVAGFGIKTAEDVKIFSECADGIVVGSAIVDADNPLEFVREIFK